MHGSVAAGGASALLAWFPLGLLGLATLGYLGAAGRQQRRGNGWSGWRCALFALGSLLLAVAVAPPVTAWAHHDLRGHMAQHLLIGMLAPLAWALAAPVTLTLRSLPTAAARRLVGALRSLPLRIVSHPIAALLLNVGGMALLYFTPLYAASRHSGLLHGWVHLHFLAAGYLFCWAVLAGPDASPHRLGLRLRLGVLFVSMAAHALLGKLMYGYLWPRGAGHPAEEIQAAAQLMYYGGDLAELLLAVALLWLASAARRESLLTFPPLR
ncbi:cytochrome c oxidase assembly protein [Billgrantia sulfidoxydans]|uniref:Cytochrome c oxidase assembly protein n=1 Tax=Billgrantia sulfidoxydans TaxID=2733484 RepID=A0ABX7W557_9GAMM|nr:cytochrome c oxidase assembly protein [Halomonas sulfidoxydans]QTP54133.1 cytochrome c oxidase assembly protein [Halomonas sulfidoxydans]